MKENKKVKIFISDNPNVKFASNEEWGKMTKGKELHKIQVRENGYYWVKRHKDIEWEIAKYTKGNKPKNITKLENSDTKTIYFYTEGGFYIDTVRYKEEELFEIDERRITKELFDDAYLNANKAAKTNNNSHFC